MTTVFGEFSISKPMTSRPGNSEIYLIGKFYKEDVNVTKMLEKMLF
jgi:23S rRNA U2552 (ribose-2'-O)-methylase RlmE/FtsJ